MSDFAVPGYWMHEQSGVLRPAIMAYLKGGQLTEGQIAVIRSYLRQWVCANVWIGPEIGALRRRVDDLIDRKAIRQWLDDATEIGIDPL